VHLGVDVGQVCLDGTKRYVRPPGYLRICQAPYDEFDHLSFGRGQASQPEPLPTAPTVAPLRTPRARSLARTRATAAEALIKALRS
jgi:hypothetical protein